MDSPWYLNLGPEIGATEFHTLSAGTKDIPPDVWATMQIGMFCTDSDSVANWKKAILQLCADDQNTCVFETQKQLWNFFQAARQVQLRAGFKAPHVISSDPKPVPPPVCSNDGSGFYSPGQPAPPCD